ncbi:MAG: DMT family transporter [Bdellovibrionaceae bacterium]|nr:DMT family transporter [Pseudobdellovibrionaceae bacterium]
MLKPLIELTVAGALWGFAFTATMWTLAGLDAPGILIYRFLGAAFFGLVPLFLFARTREGLWQKIKDEGRIAWIPGIMLFATLALQTFGLLWTTATKSAFITTMYVIIVPIVSHFTRQDRTRPRHALWVFLALVGLALFQDLHWENWNFGDTLTVGAAFAAMAHILVLAKYAPLSKSPYILNLWQLFWTGALAIFLIPLGPRMDLGALNSLGIFGMVTLIFGSGLLAFYLQIRAQEKLPPNLVSLIFLLESPFSALFAFLLLGERFSGMQWAGGFLILAACAAAVISRESIKPEHATPFVAKAD